MVRNVYWWFRSGQDAGLCGIDWEKRITRMTSVLHGMLLDWMRFV